MRSKRRPRARSEYGLQLIEKQKARFTYGISEKQFRNYVIKALSASNPTQKLYSLLESRIDNVLYRARLVKTRAQGRQASSHGHVMLNNRKITIPSILLSKGDEVALGARSAESPLFSEWGERLGSEELPAWIEADPKAKKLKIVGEPVYDRAQEVFDLEKVMEFYSR